MDKLYAPLCIVKELIHKDCPIHYSKLSANHGISLYFSKSVQLTAPSNWNFYIIANFLDNRNVWFSGMKKKVDDESPHA
jgi:hypothetical protein